MLIIFSLAGYYAHLVHRGPTTGLEEFELSPTELAQQQVLAQQGDPEATKKVSLYYGFFRQNPQEEFRWLEIGARHGNADLQREYGVAMLSEYPQRRAEAIAWLQKAAQNGNALARRDLEVEQGHP